MNRVYITGYITREPIIKHSKNNTITCCFEVGTKERRGDVSETQWHSCVAYGDMAHEIMNKTKTFVRVFVHGKLWTRTWTDEGGIYRKSCDVVVSGFEVMEKKEGAPKWTTNELKQANMNA